MPPYESSDTMRSAVLQRNAPAMTRREGRCGWVNSTSRRSRASKPVSRTAFSQTSSARAASNTQVLEAKTWAAADVVREAQAAGRADDSERGMRREGISPVYHAAPFRATGRPRSLPLSPPGSGPRSPAGAGSRPLQVQRERDDLRHLG